MPFELRKMQRGTARHKDGSPLLSFTKRKSRQRYRRTSFEPLQQRMVLTKSTIGLLLLDHASAGAIYSGGSGGVHVLGGGSLVIDSKNSKGGIDIGSGNISAAEIDITGGIKSYGSGHFQGSVVHQAATADPLAGLPVPIATLPVHGAVYASGNAVITLSPGTYQGGIHISGHASVTLLQGVYFLKGGGLT